MKRLLIIVLAFTAYTGSVIASETVEIEATQEIKISTENNSCSAQWARDYDYYRSLGYSHEDAKKRADQNMSRCIDLYPNPNV